CGPHPAGARARRRSPHQHCSHDTLGVEMLALPSDISSGALDHPLIVQTILLWPSGAVWTDRASNVSGLDPSGAVQADAEHPPRDRRSSVRIRPPGPKTSFQTV